MDVKCSSCSLQVPDPPGVEHLRKSRLSVKVCPRGSQGSGRDCSRLLDISLVVTLRQKLAVTAVVELDSHARYPGTPQRVGETANRLQ